jgi:hypothetical protein
VYDIDQPSPGTNPYPRGDPHGEYLYASRQENSDGTSKDQKSFIGESASSHVSPLPKSPQELTLVKNAGEKDNIALGDLKPLQKASIVPWLWNI